MFKNFSKILMFLLFFVFLTVSTVSAEDNVTGDIGLNEENSNYLEIQDIDNSVLGNSESNNTLKASLSTFKDLQNIIDNAYVGDTITLNKDYTYTTGDSPIFIGKSIKGLYLVVDLQAAHVQVRGSDRGDLRVRDHRLGVDEAVLKMESRHTSNPFSEGIFQLQRLFPFASPHSPHRTLRLSVLRLYQSGYRMNCIRPQPLL